MKEKEKSKLKRKKKFSLVNKYVANFWRLILKLLHRIFCINKNSELVTLSFTVA